MDKPSITVWIDPKTQVYKVELNPQALSPAQYGVVIASMMKHITKLFSEANPAVSHEEILQQLLIGFNAGLAQIQDAPIPLTH